MLNMNLLFELMDFKDVKNWNDLSRKTNIPHSTISYMLQGHDMHVSTLIELSKFFHVEVDELINKPYYIVSWTEKGGIKHQTSNIYEVAMSTRM